MDSEKSNSEAKEAAQETGQWLSRIVDIIADEPKTLDQIAEQLGQRWPGPEEVPTDDYLSFLIGEQIVEESDQPHHFQLTLAGQDIALAKRVSSSQ